ncbi:MAG: MaoC family dehydratase [Sideroxyarcus sp.]
MMKITGAEPLYLDDIHVGQKFGSASHAVDETQIKAFASQFDPQPFHLDEQAASNSLFGGLAASGWHTASITMRLLVTSGVPIAGGLVGAGCEISWPIPTRPGDVLSVESEVLKVSASRSRPDRGIVTLRSKTLNQAGEVVQEMTSRLVVFRRPAPQKK